MYLSRNPIFLWIEGIHPVWNLGRPQLFDLGNGRAGLVCTRRG